MATEDISSFVDDPWDSQSHSWNTKNQVESPDQKIRVRWVVSPTPAYLSDNVALSLEIVHTLDLDWIPMEFAATLGDFVVDHVQVNTPIIEDDREFHKVKIFLHAQATGQNNIGAVPLRFQKLTEHNQSVHDQTASSVVVSKEENDWIYVVVPAQNKEIQSSLPVDASIHTLHQSSGPIAIPSYFWHYLVGVAFVFAFFLTLFFRFARKHLKMLPPVEQLSPTQIAMKKLVTLFEQQIHKSDVKEFYFEITNIVRWFVEQKTSIRAPELTTEEFLREITLRCQEEMARQATQSHQTQSTRSHTKTHNKEKSQFISLAESKTRSHQNLTGLNQSGIFEQREEVQQCDKETNSFFSEKNRNSLSFFLEVADLVKFAQHQPSQKEIMTTFQLAAEFFILGSHLISKEYNDFIPLMRTLKEEAQKTNSFASGAYYREQYRTGQHQTGQHQTGQHQTGQHQTGQHQTGQHQTGQHQTGQHQTGQHQTGQHRTGCYQTGQHSTGRYQAGQHLTGQRTNALTHSSKVIEASESETTEDTTAFSPTAPKVACSKNDAKADESNYPTNDPLKIVQ